MGLFFRKSLNLGKALKLNFSKSGIGFSFGVKGLRFGKTPTGKSYMHAGRGGLYFRKQFSDKKQIRENAPDEIANIEENTQNKKAPKVSYRGDITFEAYKKYKKQSMRSFAFILPSLFLFLLYKISLFLLVFPIIGVLIGFNYLFKNATEFGDQIEYFTELDKRNNYKTIEDEKVFNELQGLILSAHKERQNETKYKNYNYSSQRGE